MSPAGGERDAEHVEPERPPPLDREAEGEQAAGGAGDAEQPPETPRRDEGAGPAEDLESDPAYSPEDEDLEGLKGA